MIITIDSQAHLNRIQNNGIDAAGKRRQLSEAEESLMLQLHRHPWMAKFLHKMLGNVHPFASQVRGIRYNDVRDEVIITEKQMGMDLRFRFHGMMLPKLIEEATWTTIAELRTSMYFKVTSGIMSAFEECFVEGFPELTEHFFNKKEVAEHFKRQYSRPAGGYLVLQTPKGDLQIGL